MTNKKVELSEVILLIDRNIDNLHAGIERVQTEIGENTYSEHLYDGGIIALEAFKKAIEGRWG